MSGIEQKKYGVDFCGCKIIYQFRYHETHALFKDYLSGTGSPDYDIYLSKEYMEECRWLVSPKTEDEELEYHSLMLATGNYLLHVRRALFHGVSFIWNDRVWILTGFSGVGKTTQLKYWLDLFPEEIILINGDKTTLYCDPEGVAWAGSSPWEGKEHLGFPGRNAWLGGIVVLEQGPQNEIQRMPVSEVVHPLFIEFISLPDTKQEICFQRDILRQILDTVPVWKLTNCGDKDAAVLTRRTFKHYLEK